MSVQPLDLCLQIISPVHLCIKLFLLFKAVTDAGNHCLQEAGDMQEVLQNEDNSMSLDLQSTQINENIRLVLAMKAMIWGTLEVQVWRHPNTSVRVDSLKLSSKKKVQL